MINTELKAHIAIISHKRPENVKKITEIVGGACTFFVNKGEGKAYLEAGAISVVECGTNICEARNEAITMARAAGLPSIQVSDDLKSLKHVSLHERKHVVEPVSFEDVCATLLEELNRMGYIYGGVAVTTNRLNYTGEDFSYDKLIVCDLVCIMPHDTLMFDVNMALKEDYDFTIENLVRVGGVVRCNQFLCDFPHRNNAGGANTYRNEQTEDEATVKLLNKRAGLIKKHATRYGQISLDYAAIRAMAAGQENLFDS